MKPVVSNLAMACVSGAGQLRCPAGVVPNEGRHELPSHFRVVPDYDAATPAGPLRSGTPTAAGAAGLARRKPNLHGPFHLLRRIQGRPRMVLARPRGRFYIVPIATMKQWIRALLGFRKHRQEGDPDKRPGYPPFGLVFDGIVEDKCADTIFGDDRFRVCLHPEKGRRCDGCGAKIYWPTLEFKEDSSWEPVFALHENRLEIMQAVLQQVADFLKSKNEEGRPRQLPVVALLGKRFFVDERLRQLRNVEDPHEFIDIPD